MTRTDRAVNSIQQFTRFLWSVASLLAPWLVPIAPAAFLAWSVYQTATRSGMWDVLAVAASVAAGVGLETVNIAANHAMLHLSHEWRGHWPKFLFSIFLVLAYVTAGVVSMLYLDIADAMRALGVAMFVLAPVAIAAQALTMDLARTREDVEAEQIREDRERAWEREQEAHLEELRIRLGHDEKLARIQANADVRKVRASTMPALASTSRLDAGYECPHCQREFATIQALNAHKRFCAGKVVVGANGKEI